MAQGRVTLTPADFVVAATAYVDEHGLDALTMRSLGDQLGVDPTALYRHFPSKDALISAVVDQMLGLIANEAADVDGSPRERVKQQALRSRQVFMAHPNLMSAFITSSGQMPNGLRLMRQTAEGLEAMGLEGADLVRCQQMLEGLVIGASVFDLAGSPDHVEIRRLRYRALEHPAWDDQSRSVDDVAGITHEAFELAIDGLLDVCEHFAAAISTRR
jgi:AcrR family transcriptional regulator